jgi:hypothetical protein
MKGVLPWLVRWARRAGIRIKGADDKLGQTLL